MRVNMAAPEGDLQPPHTYTHSGQDSCQLACMSCSSLPLQFGTQEWSGRHTEASAPYMSALM